VPAFGVALLVLGASSLWSVASLTDSLHKVEQAEESAVKAARMNANMVQVRRRENHVAAEPRPEIVAAARRAVAEELRQFNASFAAIEAVAGEQRRALLARLRPAAEAYLAAAERTFAAAERGDRDGAIASLRENVSPSDVVDRLTDELMTTAARLADGVKAEADADAGATVVFTVALVAFYLVGAALLVWSIGVRAISRPFVQAVARLKALAEGDTAAPIPGLGRKDEIGALAAAMETFRVVLVRQREAEARERAEAEAKAARARVIEEATARFEAEAGAVVKGVAAFWLARALG
jgi:methyl-accepting chemotaxis protein